MNMFQFFNQSLDWDFKHQSIWMVYDGLMSTQSLRKVATMPFVKHAQPATQIAGRLKSLAWPDLALINCEVEMLKREALKA